MGGAGSVVALHAALRKRNTSCGNTVCAAPLKDKEQRRLPGFIGHYCVHSKGGKWRELLLFVHWYFSAVWVLMEQGKEELCLRFQVSL